MKLMLRYRDLSVPLGATVSRHRDMIQREGLAMWGWIMRQSEQVPEDMLSALAMSLENEPAQEILLYDSGTCEVRRAQISGLSIFPGGLRIPTPEPRSTPLYMSEALCPVWFHLASIEAEPLKVREIGIVGYPTLRPGAIGGPVARTGNLSVVEVRETGATLWQIEGTH